MPKNLRLGQPEHLCSLIRGIANCSVYIACREVLLLVGFLSLQRETTFQFKTYSWVSKKVSTCGKESAVKEKDFLLRSSRIDPW